MQMLKLFSNRKDTKDLGNPYFLRKKTKQTTNVRKGKNVNVLSKCDSLLQAAVQNISFSNNGSGFC